MFKVKWLVNFLVIIFVTIVFGMISPLSAVSLEKQKVTFFVSFWSGDWLPTYVPKILLEEKLGYQVKIVNISDAAGFAAMANGEITFTATIWMPNNSPRVNKFLGKTVAGLGTVYGDCYQTAFIPKWVSEKYGIKKMSDLNNPDFADLFDIDMDKKGDWLGCDPAWICAKMNDECISLYGLDKLFVQMMGEEHFLTAVTKGRMKTKEPILVSQFYPHIMFLDYPINESMVALEDDKNFWPKMTVEKYANKAWAENNPQAANLLKEIKMTPQDIMWSMEYIRTHGDSPDALERMTREWLAGHQKEVNLWLSTVDIKR